MSVKEYWSDWDAPLSEWPIYYKDGLPFIYDDDWVFENENGERMSQHPRHIKLATYLSGLLRWYYRSQKYGVTIESTFRARVSLKDWTRLTGKDKTRKRRPYVEITPDVALIPGITSDPDEPTYEIGLDKPGPTVAFEIGSKSTFTEDLERKFRLYREVFKVKEYFIYDPLEERLWQGSRLKTWRLVNDEYLEIERNEQGWVWSEELDSWLVEDEANLWLYDQDGNKRLDRTEEAEARVRELEEQLRQLNRTNEN